MPSVKSIDRPLLLDVSRLIWRVWSRRLPTGIDRVCLAYLEHFASRSHAVVQKGDVRLVLNRKASDALFALLLRGGPGFRTKLAAFLARAAWQRATRIRGKIYLNVGHTGLDAPGLPLWLRRNKLRPVFLVHDLIPITHPHYCRAGESDRHAKRMDQMVDSAQGIIANSADTLAILEQFASDRGRQLPKRTHVAWLGCDEQASPDISARPSRPYFVMIGTLEARKNHLLLLEIWQRMVATHGSEAPMLVLIGQRGWEADSVFQILDEDTSLADHVLELGRCSDSQMIGMLSGARALLMPSFAEGFGIPIIEALQCGTPVIASDLAVFRELAGTIPLYLDPTDSDGWEKAIRAYAGEAEDRCRQISLMERYESPSWTRHFSGVDKWLETL